MSTAVTSSTKIVPIANQVDNSNIDSTSNKILRTIGNVLTSIGEHTFRASIGVISIIGIFVLVLGAPASILAFPLYLILASGASLVAGKGLENFNQRNVQVIRSS